MREGREWMTADSRSPRHEEKEKKCLMPIYLWNEFRGMRAKCSRATQLATVIAVPINLIIFYSTRPAGLLPSIYYCDSGANFFFCYFSFISERNPSGAVPRPRSCRGGETTQDHCCSKHTSCKEGLWSITASLLWVKTVRDKHIEMQERETPSSRDLGSVSCRLDHRNGHYR